MPRSSKRLVRRHTLAERWFHWINMPVLLAMMWSGVLIYWANDVYRLGYGSKTLIKFFPQWFYERFHLDSRLAEGMAWHFAFAWVFGINGLLYVLYLAFSGQWRHFWPRRDALKQAIRVVIYDSTHLRPHLETVPGSKFNAAQQLSYVAIILLGALSLLSGLAILKPIQLSPLTALMGGYEIARWLHFWAMLGFCGFIVVHVLQVLRAGWNTLRAMLTGYELVGSSSSAGDSHSDETHLPPGPAKGDTPGVPSVSPQIAARPHGDDYSAVADAGRN